MSVWVECGGLEAKGWIENFARALLAKYGAPQVPLTLSISPDPRGVHVAVHQGSECVHAEAMALPGVDAEPLFWYRPRGDDGLYEGPIHHSGIERVRKESDGWVPLYAHPARQAAQGDAELSAVIESIKDICIAAPTAEVGKAMRKIFKHCLTAERLIAHPAQPAQDGREMVTSRPFTGLPSEETHARNMAMLTHAALSTLPMEGVRQLIDAHAKLIADGNDYAYFELAYTRRTGWMAWLCSKPSESDPDRKVIARGQGDTPDEAARAAITAMGKEPPCIS